MQIRIPLATKKTDVRAFKTSIELACARSGVDEYTGTMFATHLLEEMANQLSRGRIVNIPAFGLFAPCVVNQNEAARNIRERRARKSTCEVRFSPALPLRNQVRFGAPPIEANTVTLKKHRQNHHPSSRPSKAHSRVWSAMERMRLDIAKQFAHVREGT